MPGAAGASAGDGKDVIPATLARAAAGKLPQIAAAALARPDRMVATVCGRSLMLAKAGRSDPAGGTMPNFDSRAGQRPNIAQPCGR